MNLENTQKIILACWGLGAAALLVVASLTLPFSATFGYNTRVIDMPLRTLFVSLFALGTAFLALPFLIHRTLQAFSSVPATPLRLLLWFIIAVGLLTRLLMLGSEPLMEDDYQRYLWDGALSAHGHNPYLTAPQTVYDGLTRDKELAQLARRSGHVLERINHPELRTIYPPITQAAFALAHQISPFSLTAWRGLAIGFELASLALLLVLLRALGKSPLWLALYWWNPLVIKELINSGHMEFLLVPLLLGALWAAIAHRPVLIAFLLALAVGVKIWPALLLPLYLRPFLSTPKKLIAPVLLFTTMLVLMAVPVLQAGLDQSSGFVAYTELWKTNNALVPALEGLVRYGLAPFATSSQHPHLAALIVRAFIAVTLGLLALGVAWKAPQNAREFTLRTLLVCAAMFLLSPAQLPWYAVWFTPFLVFYPFYSLALLVPLLQIYYLSFYIAVNNLSAVVGSVPVLAIWLPVWSVLAFELYRCRGAPRTTPCAALQEDIK